MQKSDGNPTNEVIVTSLSVISSDLGPENVIAYDDDESKYFFSNFKPDNWIRFDFVNGQVLPTGYKIKSINGPPNYNHPRGWFIEGSNDGDKWEIIDTRNNNEDLNGQRFVCLFKITKKKDKKKFKSIRMRLNGPNWRKTNCLAIESFELYGTLYCNKV